MSPLTEADQGRLLRLARQALEESVRYDRLPTVKEAGGALQEERGAFVTLRKLRQLRGCIGVVEAFKPLYQTVLECTRAAALHDPRFSPVTPEELPEVRMEVSVLSPPAELAPDQIEVGRHGLLVSLGEQRGVLLPQVAVEWKWDRRRFLEETCRKAGLPKSAWQYGARIEAFTAQTFGEPLEAEVSSPGFAKGHGR
jgi:AmmeMemoRadiSam system protein A